MYNSVLITGGAGFIGTNFVRLLVKKMPEVNITVLDKLTYAGNKANLSELIVENKIQFVEGDIANLEFLNHLFAKNKFDCVVNFAAETHVDRSIIDPEIFVLTNMVGTHNLLICCNKYEIARFHQISTDEVYGDLGDTQNTYFVESTPLDPTMPYAASKASADLMCTAYYNTYKMNITISRCSNNYGPYQFPEKLIPYFFRLIAENKPLPVYGDGLNVRDWLYVEDHCEAIFTILEKAKAGSIYNIGGNNEKTNLAITKEILKFLQKDENLINFVEDRKAHDRRYAMDATKIKNELGWVPKYDFQTGIKMTFEWYNNNREWWTNLTASANRIN